MTEEIRDPSVVVATGDPGDETQRNFRYQHAYGAILLIAGVSNTAPYTAIWCEHHEDILAERNDSTYDAYQIKTSQPELGAWQLNDDEIKNSIEKFVRKHELFKNKINSYNIVSNTIFFNCSPDVKHDRLKQSPHQFLKAIKAAPTPKELDEPFLTSLQELATFCSCTHDILFEVLKKTNLVSGPSRDGFDAEIAHNHLTQLKQCSELPKATLSTLRDEIIQQVFLASSLKNEDPARHLSLALVDGHVLLKAKRVSIEKIISLVDLSDEVFFRYQPIGLTLSVNASAVKHIGNLEKKFNKGDISEQTQTMKRRMISAERRLLELNAKSPEKFSEIFGQIEMVVHGECDEAKLEAKTGIGEATKPYGPLMLKNVYSRLKRITEERPKLVYNEPYELLVGVAGLLTENCTVWWSEKFNTQDAA